MKKALYQSKRCVNSKSLVSLGTDGYNVPRIAKIISDQNIRSCSSSSLIQPLLNIENQSKIVHTNKFSQRNESTAPPLKEEIEDDIEELNPKTWGRTIIIFNRLNNPKHLKNQYRLKIKEKYVYRNEMEQIESLPWSFSNREVSPKENFQLEPGHGKISIVFKHSGKGKKSKTEHIIKKVLVPRKEPVKETKVSINEIKSQNLVSKDPILDKCAPILETAKIFKQHKDSDEFVGKVSIIFNRSSKYKSRCESQMLTRLPSENPKKDTIEDMRKDLETLNQMTKNSLNTPQTEKICNLENENITVQNFTNLQKQLSKILPIKIENDTNNIPLDTNAGKIHVVFNHAKKAKRLKQLRKHFAPGMAKIKQFKKIIRDKKETNEQIDKEVCLATVKAPVVEKDEKVLINEVIMDLNEVNNQANERSKDSENIKISITQPRSEQKKLVQNKCTLLESSEWLDKEAELEKLNTVVDKTQKEALKQAMLSLSLPNRKVKKKRPKIWKSSATRIVMDKSKQTLDRLIMMNSDPQCGFVTGVPDLTRTMAVLNEIKENHSLKEKETTVQTFVFEESAHVENKYQSKATELSKSDKPKLEDSDVPSLDTCRPEYIKIVGTQKFTLKPNNDKLKPKRNPAEFNHFLSDPSEIGAMSINSTRTVETLENDRINKKPYLNIGEIKPLEQVREIGRKIKSESIKENNNNNNNHGVVENVQIEENYHNSWHAFNPDPLELKQFLKVVSNLFENSVEANNEIIDDLVDFSGINAFQANTMKKVPNQSESKHSNESKSTETRDQLYQILKNQSMSTELQNGSSLEVTKISQCLEITPLKKKKVEETPKLNNETLKKIETVTINNVNEDKELAMKDNSKTKRTGFTNVKNYFETLRTEAKLTVTEAISRNLAKERLKVYKEFSQKFEKMGLYKKQPKKILIEGLKEGLKEDLKKKIPHNPIKRDIELQDKFKNTPEGKRLQEYFDSFRFKLTTSMKEEPKRKKPQEKKIVISSKLGQLNPPTSPSQPSFTRRNK